MAFGYRKWREWRCEHCTNFKILTQTIVSAMLMRNLYFPFLFSVLVDNYLVSCCQVWFKTCSSMTEK